MAENRLRNVASAALLAYRWDAVASTWKSSHWLSTADSIWNATMSMT